jgi:acyl-coenzyme A synthetase/AMP-(fatty) acid ligase
MSRVPLLGHASLDEIFAYLPTGPVTVRPSSPQRSTLAQRLPAGRHFLNFCQDRYRISASAWRQACSMGAPACSRFAIAETLRQIRRQCPDVFCLCDSAFDSLDLPRVDFPDSLAVHPDNVTGIPDIPGELLATTVYTSGSTGMPVPHTTSPGDRWSAMRGRKPADLACSTGPVTPSSAPCRHSTCTDSNRRCCSPCTAIHHSGRASHSIRRTSSARSWPCRPPRMLVTTPFHLGTLAGGRGRAAGR